LGSLKYLVHTGPEPPHNAYAVGYVSIFMERPVKQVLRYTTGMLDFSCFYEKAGARVGLTWFSDSDMVAT
jgi:hypothetical protein